MAAASTIDPGKRDQAELNHNWDELVEIPDRYKGKVIGVGKTNLRKIETQTGVRLSVKEQEIFIVHGTEQQRRHAKMSIGETVAVARVMAFENKVCSYVDGCHLPVKCKLKLEGAEVENPILLPGSETQYRLKPAEHCERKDSYHGWNDPAYQSNLLDEVLMSLREIKDNMDSAETPKADIWCYLGTCIIRAPDEDDVLQQTWEIEEVTEKFQRPDVGGNFWKVSFTGRDDIPEDIFQSNGYKEITKGDEYISRYDLTYLTPCFYHLRCMVWVAKSSLKERLEDVPIPGEVNNLLEEIYFEDEITRTRCRGWLVLKSRRHLKRDILFPGCELDCRFIVHERRHYTVESGDVPKKEVRHTLSTYLSRLALTDENAFGLRLPDHIPDGFHLLFKRCCKRKMYSSRPEFSATLSQVNAWWIDSSENDTNRESTELHLHSEECEKLFNSTDWQPEIIVQKLPAFLNFVREIRGFVERKMKENGSKRTGIKTTISSEVP